jgi:hypothetical protein
MAVIHETTMNPTKVELLAAWLPRQRWFIGAGNGPRLARTGGFRLDDPAGEVGIEFLAGTDHSTDQAITYLMPMTYRHEPLPDGEAALIGTSQHGVLGKRWIYDGARDLVLITQLVALIQGQAEPQAQSVSNTADPTVTSRPVANSPLAVTGSVVEVSGPAGTDLRVRTASADGMPGGELLLRIVRRLEPDATTPGRDLAQPGVSATWRRLDGTTVRGTFATASVADQRS